MKARWMLGLVLLAVLVTPAWALDPPQFLFKWGVTGTGPGQFSNPFGFCVAPNGHVYVADTPNLRVQEFTETGIFVRSLTIPGFFPADVTVGADGTIYVADNGNFQVTRFDASGALLSPFSIDPGQQGIVEIGLDPAGTYLYAIYGSGVMQKFDTAGNRLLQFQVRGGGSGSFGFDTDGAIIIAFGGASLRKYSAVGTLLGNWNVLAHSSAEGVSVDASNRIYVGNEGVQIYDATGSLLTSWAGVGSGVGEVAGSPSDLAIAPNGNVYVLDAGANQVQVYGYTSTPTLPRSWGQLKLLYR